jgi:CDP-4-dehydro-6-deoxyglucose reductase, E1
MTKQPAYLSIDKRIVGSINNSDKVMNDSFWIGVWPGLGKEHLEYIYEILKNYVKLI